MAGAQDDKKLDPATFQRVLERAAELEARVDGELTEQDLLDAAAELGIDERITRAAYLQVRRQTAAAAAIVRPFDTAIELEATDTELRLSVPPLGLSAGAIGGMFFAGFWLSFVGVWTWMALHASVWFALFSLPFWIAGFTMVAAIASGMFGREELLLGREVGALTRRVGPLVRTKALETRHVRCQVLEEKTTGSGRAQRTVPAHLELEYGTRTFSLMAGRSAAELRWVAATLAEWLERR